jgi:hypothetical protein
MGNFPKFPDRKVRDMIRLYSKDKYGGGIMWLLNGLNTKARHISIIAPHM